jgi:hypothetical protein
VEGKWDEGISLFVRDEQNGRFLFNAKALQALGIDPAEARQRGYPHHDANSSSSAFASFRSSVSKPSVNQP